MALMIFNIENDLTRLKIVENLWEEHGNGDYRKIHGKTILTFIDNIGGNSTSLDDKNADFIVRSFNSTLKGVAAFDDYRSSAAFFAGIERMFVEVSEAIVLSVIKHKWMEKDDITHYGLHKEIDIQHAEDFLKVVEPEWEKDETKTLVKRGIQQGMHVFIGVYRGFYDKYVNCK
jgi:pyrroloquinoline-quinone synthase